LVMPENAEPRDSEGEARACTSAGRKGMERGAPEEEEEEQEDHEPAGRATKKPPHAQGHRQKGRAQSGTVFPWALRKKEGMAQDHEHYNSVLDCTVQCNMTSVLHVVQHSAAA